VLLSTPHHAHPGGTTLASFVRSYVLLFSPIAFLCDCGRSWRTLLPRRCLSLFCSSPSTPHHFHFGSWFPLSLPLPKQVIDDSPFFLSTTAFFWLSLSLAVSVRHHDLRDVPFITRKPSLSADNFPPSPDFPSRRFYDYILAFSSAEKPMSVGSAVLRCSRLGFVGLLQSAVLISL